MSFKTTCPKCGQKYDVEDDLLGQAVACEKCGEQFTVEKPKPTPKPKHSAQSETSYCTACGGIVHYSATVCPHCGRVRKSAASVSVSGILQVLLLFFGFPLAVAVSGAAGGNFPVIVAIWCATLIIVLRR